MAPQPLPPGTRVGRYEVTAHIATGGMGEVYKARDVELGRDVALKVLPPHLVDNPAVVERFRREARHAARLSHKNIVTLFDWGQDGGTYFLALEFVDGIDLHSHIVEKGKLDPTEAWVITVQAARALDHAFGQGITHRDIKPSNFLLTRHGRKLRVKLTDLGLARAVRDEDFRVTRDGSTVGTIDYLSPEQARDSTLADVRSDIYSLGCTLYHMLAGQAPFPDGGLGERVYKHQQVEPPDVRDFNPEVPRGLWAVLKRMLAKRPDDRYQTPAELVDALLRLRAGAGGAPDESNGGQPAPREADDSSPDSSPSSRPGSSGDAVPRSPAGGVPARRKRRSGRASDPAPLPAPDSSSLENLDVSSEQRQAAAGQYERAKQVLSTDNQEAAYAYELLVSCCKLDPANTIYRRTLREVGQDVRRRQGLGRWLAPLSVLAIKARIKAAKHAGDFRKVLEHGEEVLARAPDDTATHLDMAEAAEGLALPYLQQWLLEQACRQSPRNPEPMRRLAHAYEQHRDLEKAIAAWQGVRKLVPSDPEPARKISALSVKDTITRGNYDAT